MRRVLLIAMALVLALGLTGCTISILPAATLKGAIELEGGAPAANAKVTLTPASSAGTSWTGLTDAAGLWTAKAKPEAYKIKFEHTSASAAVEVSYDVLLPFKTYDIGLVTLPLVTTPGVTSTASGTVIWDHDGNPATAMVALLGAKVTLDGPMTKVTYTDATGSYKVAGLMPGDYDVYAEKAGFASASYMDIPIAGATATVPPIIVVQDKVDIGGYVYEDDGITPISGAAITITPVYGAFSTLSATTNASGYWQKSNVKAGLYRVKAEKAGHVAQSVDIDAMDSSITTVIMAEDLLLPTTVAPGSASAVGIVRWMLTDPVSFKSLQNVKVSFVPDGETLPIMVVYSIADGSWTAAGLPAGLYTVVFEKTGFIKQEIGFNLVSGPNNLGIIQMEPGAAMEPVKVTGKVLDQNAAPVINCKATFHPKFDWGYERTTYTNDEGAFTIPSLIAGLYDVELHKDGYADMTYTVDLTVGGESYDIGVLEIQKL